jgi:hypothetical protein
MLKNAAMKTQIIKFYEGACSSGYYMYLIGYYPPSDPQNISVRMFLSALATPLIDAIHL